MRLTPGLKKPLSDGKLQRFRKFSKYRGKGTGGGIGGVEASAGGWQTTIKNGIPPTG
jgi:hypothetical protein